MKKLLSVGCALASLSLAAETFVLKQVPSSLADWQNGEFYEGGVAPTGVATDRIATPYKPKMTIELDGSNVNGEDNAVVKFLGGIRDLMLSNAVLKVTVPEGDVCTFTFAAHDSSSQTGTIEKYGEGELFLAARLKLSTTSTSPADYQAHLHVFEGTVRLTEDAETGHQYHTYNSVTIEKPAKVITLFNDCVWQLRGLYGDGMITNEASSQCKIYVTDNSETPGVGGDFAGVVGGNIAFDVRGCVFTLSGTNSTFTGGVGGTTWSGDTPTVRIVDFGQKSRNESSAGKGSVVLGLGTYPTVYVGEGQTTDRDFQLNYVNSVFDAGTNGNLVYRGILRRWDATKRNPSLFLTGDNREPCTFAARGLGTGDVLNEFSRTVDGVTEYFNYYFGKRGTGEWYLPFTGYFQNTGVLAVENGKLSFETIDQTGQLTSLGYSTRRFENKEITHPSTEPQLPYAFLLGSDKADETGLMECKTNLAQQCTDRPFGLKGRGGFVANLGIVKYANVFGIGEGEKTLVLDGTNTLGCEVHDIADHLAESADTAVVSVEKSGSGTWVLGGDQTFTGSLTVNGGTLIVRRPEQIYRRYRLMFMDTLLRNNNVININEIGLFASDGKSQTMNLKRATSYADMKPGECAPGWNRVYVSNYGTGPFDSFELLFDGCRYVSYNNDKGELAKTWHAHNGGYRYAPQTASQYNPNLDDPHTWIPIDMYLSADAQPIDHYDAQTAIGSGTPGNYPSACQLFASVDGIHWDAVSETNTATTSSSTYSWLSTGLTGGLTDDTTVPFVPKTSYSRNAGFKTTKTAPTKVFSLLENVGPVTVANGATLKYEGAADGAPALSQVKLAADATGSIDGFAFAEDGTFEIDAMPQGSVSVGVTLPNAKDLANVAKWQVKVGNVLKPNYRVKATADGFTVTKSGLMLYVR